MLKFVRNKLISIEKHGHDTLIAHGILDDDIYGLEMDVSIDISSLKIVAVVAKWRRWTTPECPRAIPFVQDAVGLQIGEEDFSQKVRRSVGRRACRHHANLLIECCYTAQEAAQVITWEDEHISCHSFNTKAPSPKTEVRKKVSHGTIIDLHVHSSPASPCSSTPVEEQIKEAKRIGLNGICLTDHNYVWEEDVVEGLRQQHEFLVLRGNEITTDQGDMLVFGLHKEIRGIIKLEELREEVSRSGGFIIAAHPFRGFLTVGIDQLGLSPEEAMKRPLFNHVDALEALNGRATDSENRFTGEVAARLGMPITGGSDAHEVSEIGIYATRFDQSIENEKDLISALQSGNYFPTVFRKNQVKSKDNQNRREQ